jgi:hypothetical protein
MTRLLSTFVIKFRCCLFDPFIVIIFTRIDSYIYLFTSYRCPYLKKIILCLIVNCITSVLNIFTYIFLSLLNPIFLELLESYSVTLYPTL